MNLIEKYLLMSGNLESTQDHKEEAASNALIKMDEKKKVITTVT